MPGAMARQVHPVDSGTSHRQGTERANASIVALATARASAMLGLPALAKVSAAHATRGVLSAYLLFIWEYSGSTPFKNRGVSRISFAHQSWTGRERYKAFKYIYIVCNRNSV